jgi:predicted transcriptional regulator
MSLSPVKRLVLETMWMINKSATAAEIAKEVGLNFSSVMMHILGLTKLGYAESHEKGHYVITENGKKALGFPEVNKEKAGELLAYLPVEKSFHFYADVDKPLNIHAASLGDFCDKILNVDPSSIEFHFNRGDFEAWLTGLGDFELTRKVFIIKEQKRSGEELRRRLYDAVKNRCEELTKIKAVSGV